MVTIPYSAHNCCWWVPFVGSDVGAICGVVVYLAFVGFHLKQLPMKDVGTFDVSSTVSVAPDHRDKYKRNTICPIIIFPNLLFAYSEHDFFF